MRVAVYAPMKPPDHPVPSGDRRMARLILSALERGGHRPVLASRLRVWDDGRTAGRQLRLRAAAWRIADQLVQRWQGAADRPQAWVTYHNYHKAPDWIGPRVAEALGLPYVIIEASHAEKQRSGPWALGVEGAEAAIRRADRLLALTGEDAEGLEALAPGRVERLAPFLDTAPFAAAAAERAAWRLHWWGAEGGPPRLLAVAMMRAGDKEASYALLAEALAQVKDRPWRLAVAGDGPARDPVLVRLPPGRIDWLGTLAPDELPGLYAASDLFVWPAVNEAFGMVLMEAQAAGLPVVAGAERGVPQVVDDGHSGVLVPPRDTAAFAAAVAGLLGDPPRRDALAAQALASAPQRLGLDHAAARLSGVLEALCPA
ncbi:MAG: glycosyltransferase family 4 protein [Rhodospirillaceae bacterium]|nr:glycosyltransferase family 4 protein [Rhodospirillaceae bacterium]